MMETPKDSSRQAKIHDLINIIHGLPSHVWDDIAVGSNSTREVVELLCGALWHLDYASALGELDPTPVRDREQVPSLWKQWLDAKERISNSEPKSLIQSMLVSDACLRLAGAVEIFPELPNEQQPLFPRFEDIEKKREKTPLDLSIRRVVIHRDAFMHGELPQKPQRKRREQRWNAREQENCSETYTVAQLFDDCVDISAEIAKAVHQKLSAQV